MSEQNKTKSKSSGLLSRLSSTRESFVQGFNSIFASKKDLDEQVEEMYKVLIDGSGFSKAMNYDGCQELIRKYESNAKRLNRLKPSLVLVKQ